MNLINEFFEILTYQDFNFESNLKLEIDFYKYLDFIFHMDNLENAMIKIICKNDNLKKCKIIILIKHLINEKISLNKFIKNLNKVLKNDFIYLENFMYYLKKYNIENTVIIRKKITMDLEIKLEKKLINLFGEFELIYFIKLALIYDENKTLKIINLLYLN